MVHRHKEWSRGISRWDGNLGLQELEKKCCYKHRCRGFTTGILRGHLASWHRPEDQCCNLTQREEGPAKASMLQLRQLLQDICPTVLMYSPSPSYRLQESSSGFQMSSRPCRPCHTPGPGTLSRQTSAELSSVWLSLLTYHYSLPPAVQIYKLSIPTPQGHRLKKLPVAATMPEGKACE